MKIFSSPGLSSRPLTRLEKIRETYRDYREGYGDTIIHWLQLKVYNWRHRNEITRNDQFVEELLKALETGGSDAKSLPGAVTGAALQIEDLSPVMRVVTYQDVASPKRPFFRLPWWAR